MNFNLISPDGNGYDYTTRFREDIVIKPNSKVYLNFSQLSQRVNVSFEEDQKITISSTDMIPEYKPDDFSNNILSEELTFPKGKYTFDSFKNKFNQLLNTLNAKNQLHIYSAIDDTFGNNQDNYFNFGYEFEPSFLDKEVLTLDGVNNLDFSKTTDGYVKTSATPVSPYDYDCYGLSTTHYLHYAIADNEDASFMSKLNPIYFETNTNWNSMGANAKVCLGLYSTEYMTVYSGGGNIINGANFYTVSGVPKTFLNVEIDNTSVEVSVAKDSAGNAIRDWGSFDTDINTHALVFSKDLIDIMPLNEPARFSLQVFLDENNGDFKRISKRFYFRLIEENGDKIVYNSKDNDVYFPSSFFGIGGVPNTPDKANVGIPFKILLSSNTQNIGFKDVQFSEFIKTKHDATDPNPNSIVVNYALQFTDELSNYLNIVKDTFTRLLYPNIIPSINSLNLDSHRYETNINLDFVNSSYTCYLEELPTSNYKNTETKQNGGYSQNILANLPVPFSNLVNNVSKDNSIITGLYQPNFQIISNMKNQAIRSNHFRVIIKRMEDDKPATELLRSVINFTILEE
jgi:hypothetical protein